MTSGVSRPRPIGFVWHGCSAAVSSVKSEVGTVRGLADRLCLLETRHFKLETPRKLALFFHTPLDIRILITLCILRSYGSKWSHRNWVCLYNGLPTDYRLPTTSYGLFGFVLLHASCHQNPHNPLCLQFLRLKMAPRELGLFVQRSSNRLRTTDYRLLGSFRAIGPGFLPVLDPSGVTLETPLQLALFVPRPSNRLQTTDYRLPPFTARFSVAQ
jgi:hypothetical protein